MSAFDTLADTILVRFGNRAKRDSELSRYLSAIQSGTGGWGMAQDYAVRIGELMSAVLEGVPAERLLIADSAAEFLIPSLAAAYALIADACELAVNALNRMAGVRLRALRPDMPTSRADDLAGKFDSYENVADALWVLGEPVISWCLYIVDDAVRINAEAQAAAGLFPKVRRISDSETCPFCVSHAGIYALPLRRDVFRRHERCRCQILLEPSLTNTGAPARMLYAAANKAARDARIARVHAAELRIAK